MDVRSTGPRGLASPRLEILEGIERQCHAAESGRMMRMIGVEIRTTRSAEPELTGHGVVALDRRRIVIAVPHLEGAQAIRRKPRDGIVLPHQRGVRQ